MKEPQFRKVAEQMNSCPMRGSIAADWSACLGRGVSTAQSKRSTMKTTSKQYPTVKPNENQHRTENRSSPGRSTDGCLLRRRLAPNGSTAETRSSVDGRELPAVATSAWSFPPDQFLGGHTPYPLFLVELCGVVPPKVFCFRVHDPHTDA